MHLRSLALANFRSHIKKKFTFGNTTVIVGPNAIGKTTLLEAIYLLAVGRSFRAESDREVIAFGSEFSRVEGTCYKDGTAVNLEVLVTHGVLQGKKVLTKRFSRNKAVKKMTDFIGSLKAVLFWPEDLRLIVDSPSVRRTYLDFVLSQSNTKYAQALSSYEKGIRARNKVLESIRERRAGQDELEYWNDLIIEKGTYLSFSRAGYVDFLNQYDEEITGVSFSIFYDKSIISPARLLQYKNEEVYAGKTLVGPHRDDIKFEILNSKSENKRDLARFGSRGEQRLGILWLKLGERNFIKERSGEEPILLLDDIFSEFDHYHRKMLFDFIGKQQSIITTTDIHLVEENYKREAKIIEL